VREVGQRLYSAGEEWAAMLTALVFGAVDFREVTLKVLRRFLRWLHRSPDFTWRDQDRIIDDATKRSVKTLLTSLERKRSSNGPESWTVDELGVLFAHATPLDPIQVERVFTDLTQKRADPDSRIFSC
jgi:hypothetical protein